MTLMTGHDTTADAQRVLLDIYRRMPLHIKAARVFEAYRTGKMLAMTGLRLAHPDAYERQIWRLWARSQLGPKLFHDAYEDLPDE